MNVIHSLVELLTLGGTPGPIYVNPAVAQLQILLFFLSFAELLQYVTSIVGNVRTWVAKDKFK